jgi:hypothetical protein
MLIRNTEQIKQVIVVGAQFDYERIMPYLNSGEVTVIAVIGRDFYDELDTYAGGLLQEEPVAADPLLDAVLSLLRPAIANISFADAFDLLNANISNQGFHRYENEEQGRKALFSGQELRLRGKFARDGHMYIERCLAHLEANIADYATYAASAEYARLQKMFIQSAAVFSQSFAINANRLLFLRLQPYLQQAEDFEIAGVLGFDFFTEIKNEMPDLSEANAKILPYIQKALAHTAIARGGYELIAEFTENGFVQWGLGTNRTNAEIQQSASERIMQHILQRAKMNSDAYVQALERYLRLNSASYPTYANSTAFGTGSTRDFGRDGKVVVI